MRGSAHIETRVRQCALQVCVEMSNEYGSRARRGERLDGSIMMR